jgi:hypothetical protein
MDKFIVRKTTAGDIRQPAPTGSSVQNKKN